MAAWAIDWILIRKRPLSNLFPRIETVEVRIENDGHGAFQEVMKFEFDFENVQLDSSSASPENVQVDDYSHIGEDQNEEHCLSCQNEWGNEMGKDREQES